MNTSSMEKPTDNVFLHTLMELYQEDVEKSVKKFDEDLNTIMQRFRDDIDELNMGMNDAPKVKLKVKYDVEIGFRKVI